MNVVGAVCREVADRGALPASPLVSVLMLTYNHAAFVGRAIEGIIDQRTKFRYELVIGDDASADGTADVCEEYQRRFPDRIRLVIWERNISFGRSGNLYEVCRRARGKYVAFCEGDDYWTDLCKLQKQVDYMESHPDCTLCFHPVRVCWDDGRLPDSTYPPDCARFARAEPTIAELLRWDYMQTNSLMYRWNADGKLFEEFPLYELPADWMLNLLHARAGRIGFINETMSVYCRHAGGLWTDAWRTPRWFARLGYRSALFYAKVQRLFGVDRVPIIRQLVLVSLAMRRNRSDVLKIMRPSKAWTYLAPVLVLCFAVGEHLAPSESMRKGFGWRRILWNVVSRRRVRIRKVLSDD